MSLKLMGVEGEMLWQDDPKAKTMDLIMMGAQRFLAPNLPQFYDMEVALDKGGLAKLWFFVTHPRIAWTVITAFTKCANLLEVPYFSQTAYLFGSRAVQYHITPHQPAKSKIPRHASKNFLRERLVQQLATEEASFDFEVQFQVDPKKMPIEDANVAWKESLSPYRKVGTIRIPSQTCDSPAHVAFCENISFNPWRTLPEHRPLGGINRARREVYPAISQFRHHRNAVPVREPVVDGAYPNLQADDGFIEPPQVNGAGATRRRMPLKVAVVALAILLVGSVFLVYRVYHPPLPPEVVFSDTGQLNNGVWTEAERQRYYHLSQGSQIMPYDWFVALEQPGLTPKGLFIAPEYTTQFRLIPDPNPLNNPDRVPVGFAKDTPDPVTNIENVGLTCSACHTAQMTYKGTGLRIDGAPGMVNFNAFLTSLVLTTTDTLLNPAKFDRFARRVLKDRYNSQNAKQLKDDVKNFLGQRLKPIVDQFAADFGSGQKPVPGGFGRIDALGSGGNRLYGALDNKNLRALNAPVKALPLWYVNRYAYVQTNGSIRQPMARNMIEALAVNASLVFPEPKKDRYISSVRLQNMNELEEFAARFTAPIWPGNVLGKLNEEAVLRGEPLYKKHCAACHDPQMEKQPDQNDPVAVKYKQTFFVLRLFPVNVVGTDPLDATNFAERTLDASAIDEGKDVPGAKIIALVLSSTQTRQYESLGIPIDEQEKLNGYRANNLRACKAYPARPLAGVWANSPYLHNASVPNLYELLLPAAQRSKKFYTGNVEFDPVNVGFVSDGKQGGFLVDTTIPGNWNTGHEYGTSLNHQQRMDLIEYLKALS
ncbi:MAG TPA: di-heme-cytochrome C peroxidase, partial [Pyrinomonadaceae bacterium]|nr:di-heme-cytochrome C peroxidase [Pyrinomonadaceae bacterium]